MTALLKMLVAILITFALAALLMPLVFREAKKIKMGQPILKYVNQHKQKAGTPTMGGIIFVLPAFAVAMIFGGNGVTIGKVAAATMLAYSILGFLDDFIKVKFSHNDGLKPYQKIIGQLGIAVVVTIFCYRNPYIGSSINIPFIATQANLGWFYIPFCIFVFLAISNGVNLTDGLDGLAASCNLIYFITFAAVIFISYSDAVYMGQTVYAGELKSMMMFCGALVGGLLVFLLANSNPARIFMGDTGSMGLGGASACVALFTQNPMLILFVGIMYIISCITVIIQVVYFKASKGKRVFLMAPFHHHLELKGLKETKIVAIYNVVTILAGIVAIISVVAGVYGFNW
ncbi:MAG: phospho-N-acetylmuramoyl-pentapeptide-transferase [Clostridia bacterium]|nr:phospho-N-acetylmuramoyl-pentapeptide-transferase [Clostridia bacterium]